VYINQPKLPELIRRFLYSQLHRGPTADPLALYVNLAACPQFSGKVRVFHSAIAEFHAPSDLSGIGGMHRQWIRATPSWRGGPARYDCVFIETDANTVGFRGLHVAHVILFFSFIHASVTYPCALVKWFTVIGDQPCEDTGYWMVKPELHPQTRHRLITVVHLDCILRGAHLMPIYGNAFLPCDFHFSDTLNAFQAYFVNKFINHNAFDIAF
jgi:hypothetical protein